MINSNNNKENTPQLMITINMGIVISLGQGESKQIKITSQDKPEQVALQFCRENCLHEDIAKTLSDFISSSLPSQTFQKSHSTLPLTELNYKYLCHQ